MSTLLAILAFALAIALAFIAGHADGALAERKRQLETRQKASRAVLALTREKDA